MKQPRRFALVPPRIWMLAVLPLVAVCLVAAQALTSPASPANPSGQEAGIVDDGPQFVGEKSCKKCHFSQHRSWAKTHMAKAFDTLKPGSAAEAKTKHGLDPAKDYTKDPTCLECHTTGYGKPGGYPAVVAGTEWTKEQVARAALMEGVQCESCHGPGSLSNPYKKENEKYQKAEVLKLGMVEADAANCRTCHNTKSPTVGDDYKFDYEALIKDASKVHKHKKLKHKH